MESFKPNDLFRHFIYWIIERQNIFWKRYKGVDGRLTDDPFLRRYKFTNVYRVLDRTTQYLLRHVIYNGKHYTPVETLWRILLFKHFNLPDTWDLLIRTFGDITMDTNVDDINEHLNYHKAHGGVIYNNAYMLTTRFMARTVIKHHLGKEYSNRHEAYLKLYEKYILRTNMLRQILQKESMAGAFYLLCTVPTMGDFVAYQYLQDWNYTDYVDWDDSSFCSPGRLTKRGIEQVFDIKGTPDHAKIVRWTHKNFEQLLNNYDFLRNFKPLPEWMPRIPDLSNCYCETDKYLQLIYNTPADNRKRIRKTLFKPIFNRIDYMFPPKWNLKLNK